LLGVVNADDVVVETAAVEAGLVRVATFRSAAPGSVVVDWIAPADLPSLCLRRFLARCRCVPPEALAARRASRRRRAAPAGTAAA
jgi:hypothetical protein